MIDVRQHEELQASGTIKGSMHIPKGVAEFRLNNNDEISFDTSIYVFCAGCQISNHWLQFKNVGYQKVFNLVAFQDILDQGAEIQSVV